MGNTCVFPISQLTRNHTLYRIFHTPLRLTFGKPFVLPYCHFLLNGRLPLIKYALGKSTDSPFTLCGNNYESAIKTQHTWKFDWDREIGGPAHFPATGIFFLAWGQKKNLRREGHFFNVLQQDKILSLPTPSSQLLGLDHSGHTYALPYGMRCK